jgi:4-hydroxy-2-oxoheptanedioate aldolase
VPANDVGWIGKVLDAGAEAVIIPMIETREQAEEAVANCRFYPQGRRSYGPIRAGLIFDKDPETLNRETACIVMIETMIGAENADEICSVAGVDGVYIGPGDLAITYGLKPGHNPQPGPVLDAIETIRTTCRAHDIAAGIQCHSGTEAREMADAGFTMVTICSDTQLLQSALKQELAAAGISSRAD